MIAAVAVPTRDELAAAHCWERDDLVPGRPGMTDFRRRLRFHQARWREAHGHPIGTQPIVPKPGGKPARLVGSRLPYEYAHETGANFLTPAAHDAARQRSAIAEPRQTFDHQRLWADLLWSPTMAFNLFGDLAADLDLADHAVHTWWPDAPGVVSGVRFAHSPGRLDPSYLNNLSTFDAAFILTLPGGSQAVVGLDVKYHERIKREIPRPTNLARYREVFERSGNFTPAAFDAVNKTVLSVMWLEHLLVLSMLQQERGAWAWGRYVVVHPAANTDYADAAARYRELLTDPSTFSSVTTEQLIGRGALPEATAKALRDRYLPG